MQRNYEEAVKIFLTKYTKYEKAIIKDDKRKILQNWNNLDNLSARNRILDNILREYQATKDWKQAYFRIPPKLREMYVGAYQSYLWNECIKELLKRIISKKSLYIIPYAVDLLFFYKKISANEKQNLPERFQTISENIVPEEYEKEIIGEILEKENLSLNDFAIKKQVGNFFKTYKRQVIVYPKDFSISKQEIDELNDKGNENRFKITASFTLPKGSYATIVMKRLFNQ
jgi:tRNA pseudouridine13 synthase